MGLKRGSWLFGWGIESKREKDVKMVGKGSQEQGEIQAEVQSGKEADVHGEQRGSERKY